MLLLAHPGIILIIDKPLGMLRLLGSLLVLLHGLGLEEQGGASKDGRPR